MHFHIIPKFEETGLGLGWTPKRLEQADAQRLLSDMHAALATESLSTHIDREHLETNRRPTGEHIAITDASDVIIQLTQAFVLVATT